MILQVLYCVVTEFSDGMPGRAAVRSKLPMGDLNTPVGRVLEATAPTMTLGRNGCALHREYPQGVEICFTDVAVDMERD